MQCSSFGQCGSCTLYDKNYDEQLLYKKERVTTLFEPLFKDAFDVMTSRSSNFRYRSEFRVWHEDNTMHYAMTNMEKNGTVLIEACSIVSVAIVELMPKILKAVKDKEIDFKLFHIDFLSTLSGEMVVSLLYHKALDDVWEVKATQLAKELNISIIGRSRKQKRVIGADYVMEKLTIEGNPFIYQQIENSFTQPNPEVNIKMIEWVLAHLNDVKGDLLELYCGAGNFTLPMSKKFDKVLATEISKSSISAARKNCELNSIENISFIRMSSEEFVQAHTKQRVFTRLKEVDLDTFDLNTIFVDPPRSGLDDTTTQLSQNFDTIIYISCNFETFKRDLDVLTQTHDILKMALFDQFAYTNHLEMGAILTRKE